MLNRVPRTADVLLVSSKRYGESIVGALLAAAVIVAGMVYSGSQSGDAVAEVALTHARVESASSSVVGARVAVQQALLFGPPGDATAMATYDDAKTAVATMEERIADLPAGLRPVAADRLAEGFRVVLADVDAGAWDSAGQRLGGEVEIAYDATSASLAASRDAAAAEIVSIGDSAQRVASITRFVVAVGVPAVTGLALWWLSRRREERRVLADRLEAERSLRLSQESFIANVSHELRTPLTTILGFTQLIDSDAVEEPAERAELLRLVYAEAADLSRMVDDLVVAARLKTGEVRFRKEDVDVVTEVWDVVEAAAEPGQVRVEVAPGVVRGDKHRFRQIIRNLLANAIRYGGPDIMIEGGAVGWSYRVVVSDDGPGLQTDEPGKLFDRFSGSEDTSLERGGLGLGLSVVKSLTEGMGGTVRYERIDGRTNFAVDLPRSLEADLAAVQARSAHGVMH